MDSARSGLGMVLGDPRFSDILGDPYHGYRLHGPAQGCEHLVVYNPQTGAIEAIEIFGYEIQFVPVSAVPEIDLCEKVSLCY